jgi:hypothetical protein
MHHAVVVQNPIFSLLILKVFRKKGFKVSYKSSRMGHISGRVASDNMAAHPRMLVSCMPLLCETKPHTLYKGFNVRP